MAPKETFVIASVGIRIRLRKRRILDNDIPFNVRKRLMKIDNLVFFTTELFLPSSRPI